MVKRDLITNIILALVAIVGVILLRVFVFSTTTVTSEQANTYLNEGDYVMINKTDKANYNNFVSYTVDGETYLGRVIAKEDDTVTFMDDIFYLNDVAQEEVYLQSLKAAFFEKTQYGAYFTEDFTLQTLTNSDLEAIPENYYLILNDDRQNTKDSREFGLIEESQIKGVVTFRLLPLSDFGFLTTE